MQCNATGEQHETREFQSDRFKNQGKHFVRKGRNRGVRVVQRFELSLDRLRLSLQILQPDKQRVSFDCNLHQAFGQQQSAALPILVGLAHYSLLLSLFDYVIGEARFD